MQEIKVTVSTEIDPKDITIDCSTASAYCVTDLSCFDCPFSQGSRSLAEIIHMYMVLIAKEARHD